MLPNSLPNCYKYQTPCKWKCFKSSSLYSCVVLTLISSNPTIELITHLLEKLTKPHKTKPHKTSPNLSQPQDKQTLTKLTQPYQTSHYRLPVSILCRPRRRSFLVGKRHFKGCCRFTFDLQRVFKDLGSVTFDLQRYDNVSIGETFVLQRVFKGFQPSGKITFRSRFSTTGK